MNGQGEDRARWQKRLRFHRFPPVAGHAIVHGVLALVEPGYDGGHEVLEEWWGAEDSEGGALTLFESLSALLLGFSREQRQEALAADPGEFARAFNIEKRLGLIVSPESIPESLLRGHGLGNVLRMPAFDGEVLSYQALKSPGLQDWAPGEERVWTLSSVSVTVVDCAIRHEVLTRYSHVP